MNTIHDVTGLALRELFPPLTGRGWLSKSSLVSFPVNVIEGDVYGVELELDDVSRAHLEESISLLPVGNAPNAINWLASVVEDPSLADGGEIVLCPMTVKELGEVLPKLIERLPPYVINDRCSTHVHMNALDLSWGEVRAMLFMYLILEKFIFRWVGAGRDTNVFTAPMYSSTMNADFGRWCLEPAFVQSRYLAFNAQGLVHMGDRIHEQVADRGGHRHPRGTVEFRHMPGTPKTDAGVQKLVTWIQMLDSLKSGARGLAKKKDYERAIISLNSSSAYGDIVQEVAPYLASQLFSGLTRHGIQSGMEDAVSRLKYQQARYERCCLPIKPGYPESSYMKWLMKDNPSASKPKSVGSYFIPEPLEEAVANIRAQVPQRPRGQR